MASLKAKASDQSEPSPCHLQSLPFLRKDQALSPLHPGLNTCFKLHIRNQATLVWLRIKTWRIKTWRCRGPPPTHLLHTRTYSFVANNSYTYTPGTSFVAKVLVAGLAMLLQAYVAEWAAQACCKPSLLDSHQFVSCCLLAHGLLTDRCCGIETPKHAKQFWRKAAVTHGAWAAALCNSVTCWPLT